MTNNDIDDYIPNPLNRDEDFIFLDKINEYVNQNRNDEECLQLWWKKTTEIYEVDVPYDRNVALKVLHSQIRSLMEETLH